jgi:hypothetical protein
MKKLLIMFGFLSFFFVTDLVNAASCEYSELARLKLSASNISISYDYVYDIESDDVKFSIRFDNLVNNIFIEDYKGNVYIYNGENSLVLNDYEDGNKYKFIISTDTTNCLNKVLNVVYVNLPKYNSFYNDEVCEKAKDYYMCQMWYQHDLTEKEFVAKVEKYLNENNGNNGEKPDEVIDSIISFILEYYYYFIGLSVIIVLIIIIFFKSKEEEFDLST